MVSYSHTRKHGWTQVHRFVQWLVRSMSAQRKSCLCLAWLAATCTGCMVTTPPPATNRDLDLSGGPPWVGVELTDGQLIVGKIPDSSLKISVFGKASDIPLTQIRHLLFAGPAGEVRTVFANGDVSSGTLAAEELKMVVNSEIRTVPRWKIRAIRVQQRPAFLTPQMRKGLVVHYAFDWERKGQIEDVSGNDLHATAQGAAWTSDGTPAGAYRFGGNDYIDCGPDKRLGMTRKVTFCAWIRPERCKGRRYMAGSLQKSGSRGWQLSYVDRGDVTMHVTAGSLRKRTRSITSKSKCPVGTWSHVAGVWDGEFMRLYVNGHEEVKGKQTGSMKSIDTLHIGKHARGTGFSGMMDEVMVFNRALSAREVRTVYLLAGLPER